MSTLGEDNDWGGYAVGLMNVKGAFRINGTSDPDAIHDANTNVIKSVVRNSAGVFTVTLESAKNGVPYIPAQVLGCPCWASASDTTPVKTVIAQYVTGSWSAATRSFQIVTVMVGDTGAAAYFDAVPDDPDDNTWVGFTLEGPVPPPSCDLATGTKTVEDV